MKKNAKKSVMSLTESFALLHELSQIIVDFDEKRDLNYFSELYLEIEPAVNNVVIYVVKSNLPGVRKMVDEYIFSSQKVVEYLKILHDRFQLLIEHSTIKDLSKWYCASNKESGEIVRDIKFILDRMYMLKDEQSYY